MARMHSRKKGKSKSIKPGRRITPSWVRYKAREVELLITKLAKEGKTASQIGMILRDDYGIPDVKSIAKKKITAVLKEKKLLPEIPDDLMDLIRKSVTLGKHLEENKHDMSANRGLQLTESKIKRIVKYYKKTNKLPLDWKYDKESIKLFVE
jgi:small subunit ribosomal protein S15